MAREYPFVISIRPSGKRIVLGAFQMSDTFGFPLANSIDWAEKNNSCISMPHYFASAMEHGWDDNQVFSKMREAFVDCGDAKNFEFAKLACIKMFMDVASSMPGKNAIEVGRSMRELIEQ